MERGRNRGTGREKRKWREWTGGGGVGGKKGEGEAGDGWYGVGWSDDGTTLAGI